MKNQRQEGAADRQEQRHQHAVGVGLEDAEDHEEHPDGRQHGPSVSKGRVGSAGSGSSIRRLRTTITVTTTAWKTKAARQLIAVVIKTADQRARRGADAPHPADETEGPRPRSEVVERERREAQPSSASHALAASRSRTAKPFALPGRRNESARSAGRIQSSSETTATRSNDLA